MRPPSSRVVSAALAALLSISALAGCRGHAPPATGVMPDTTGVGRERLTGQSGDARTLGVLPFRSDSEETRRALAFALADLLSTDLARSRMLVVVERSRLDDVLRELDRGRTGVLDSATAPRAGRLLQAQRLVLGTVGATPGTTDVRLTVHVADVAGGTVEQAVDARAPLVDVLEAEKALAFRLFDQLGVPLTPDERAAIRQRPTADIVALLAYGRGVQREALGDFFGAAAEFTAAQRRDPTFALAGQRAMEARARAEEGTSGPLFVTPLHPVEVTRMTVLDRINRPFDFSPEAPHPGSPVDPAFPGTSAAVIVTILLP